jgi:DNA polymerase elongation subunit (family B)
MNNNNVIIFDIETMQELFLVVCMVPGKAGKSFQVSKWKNELDKFVKYTEANADAYWVGYNNLRFDSQVVEWVLRNYDNWHELSNLEICAKIAQKAADVIHDANYDVFPEYREHELSLKQIDLFKINHYDNKNRMVSLKRLEFEMDLENIEEMPIHHSKTNMTKEEIDLTIDYCYNDVDATYEFYKVTLGDTDHPLYRGNNQIELRRDIEEEFGIPCLNYSDSKIGDEMIKKYYCSEKGIEYKELPRKGYFRKNIELKNCIAKYVMFETTQLSEFLKKMKKTTLGLQDDFKEHIDFHGNVYSFMKGGLHTENSPKVFEADEECEIIDWDVSSYYPAIIINNGQFPAHLGKEFLRGYKQMFEKRLELKPLAKKDRKIKGIVGALKLAVNSVYGKSSDMQSWIFDRQLTMFTTITGELSLMMLIEQYELNGIHVISANTDGVTIKVKKELIPLMHQLNDWWCNITQYELERTDYSKIIFSTVNDYLAIMTNGEIKKKGDFLTDFELHKNKSARVVPIALEQYFVHGVPVDVTIRNHQNLYDFCLRQKATRSFHYEGTNRITGEVTVYDKLIRYYVSNTGDKIFKIKNPECQTRAAAISQIEAGEWVCKVCNFLPKGSPVDNVNYDYYIEKANRIITKINTEGKRIKTVFIPNQLNLFE